MLQELNMVEQRYQAVLEALESEASITEVAIRMNLNALDRAANGAGHACRETVRLTTEGAHSPACRDLEVSCLRFAEERPWATVRGGNIGAIQVEPSDAD